MVVPRVSVDSGAPFEPAAGTAGYSRRPRGNGNGETPPLRYPGFGRCPSPWAKATAQDCDLRGGSPDPPRTMGKLRCRAKEDSPCGADFGR